MARHLHGDVVCMQAPSELHVSYLRATAIFQKLMSVKLSATMLVHLEQHPVTEASWSQIGGCCRLGRPRQRQLPPRAP